MQNIKTLSQCSFLGIPNLRTYDSVNRAEKNCKDDEPYVGVMIVINCWDSKEHENNGFSRAAQHFHRVLDSCVWLEWDVGLYVVFHCDSTERYPISEEKNVINS